MRNERRWQRVRKVARTTITLGVLLAMTGCIVAPYRPYYYRPHPYYYYP
jgi:hypothetical protein